MTWGVSFPGQAPPEVPPGSGCLDLCQAAGVASRLWVPGCTSPLSAVTEKTHDFVRYREKLLREERGHLGYLGVFAVSPGLCCPDFQKV